MIFAPLRAFSWPAGSSRHSDAAAEALAEEAARCAVPILCSMKITEDVQMYAAEQGLTDEGALQGGLEENARDFAKAGAEGYAEVYPFSAEFTQRV